MSSLAYPRYKDSGADWIGQTPAHWEVKRLGYFFSERRTKVSDKDYIPLSVTKQGVVPQLESAAKTDDGDNRKLVLTGDFVINSRSDRKGSSGLSSLDGSVSLINTVIQPQPFVLGRFIHYLMRSPPFQEEFYRYGKGLVADLWSTNYTGMQNIMLSLPPLPEQVRIADFLDRKTTAIDAAIANKQELIAALAKYREAVIAEAVAPREGWRTMRLKHLVTALPKSTLPAGTATEEGSVPFYVSGAQVKRTEQSVVTSGIAAVLATGGSATVHLAIGDFAYSTDCWALESRESTEYLYFLLEAVKPLIAEEGFRGAGIKHLDKDWLLDLPIKLPIELKQRSIANTLQHQVNTIYSAISKAEQAVAMLKDYRASLISEAVTGKLTIPD